MSTSQLPEPCANCGRPMPANVDVCPSCAWRRPEGHVDPVQGQADRGGYTPWQSWPPSPSPPNCPNCGYQIPAGASMCPNCGWTAQAPFRSPLAQAEEARRKSQRTWLTACLVGSGVMVVMGIVLVGVLISAWNSFTQACNRM